jgi:pimeloyl-ACP methyl ester carboxylesterase
MKKQILAILFVLLFSVAAFGQVAQQEKTATVFAAKIRYVEAGDSTKPVIVLLHGLGGSADSAWALNIQSLAAKYRVIALDQIGFGKSDKPMINYRVGTYVDYLDKFLSELKIEKATLVGNSMGGWISVLYAAKYPAKVEKIVLVDAAGYAPPKDFDYKVLQGLNPSTREGTQAMIKRIFYNPAFQSDAAVDNFITLRSQAGDGYTIQALINSIARGEDYFDAQVKIIKQPTLIVWGKQDGLVPVSEGARLNKDIAGSQMIVFDQAGHVPQFEKASDFNAAVLRFLEGK